MPVSGSSSGNHERIPPPLSPPRSACMHAGVYKPSGAPGKFGKPALLSRVTPAKPEILACFRQLVRACGRSPHRPSPSSPESQGLGPHHVRDRVTTAQQRRQVRAREPGSQFAREDDRKKKLLEFRLSASSALAKALVVLCVVHSCLPACNLAQPRQQTYVHSNSGQGAQPAAITPLPDWSTRLLQLGSGLKEMHVIFLGRQQ